MKLKCETDTPEQKLARSQKGGNRHAGKKDIEQIWDEIQAKNRAAGSWACG